MVRISEGGGAPRRNGNWTDWFTNFFVGVDHLFTGYTPEEREETQRNIEKGKQIGEEWREEAEDWAKDKADDVVDWGKDKAEDVIEWGANTQFGQNIMTMFVLIIAAIFAFVIFDN